MNNNQPYYKNNASITYNFLGSIALLVFLFGGTYLINLWIFHFDGFLFEWIISLIILIVFLYYNIADNFWFYEDRVEHYNRPFQKKPERTIMISSISKVIYKDTSNYGTKYLKMFYNFEDNEKKITMMLKYNSLSLDPEKDIRLILTKLTNAKIKISMDLSSPASNPLLNN